MEYLNGVIEVDTSETDSIDDNMKKEHILTQKERKEREFEMIETEKCAILQH